MQSGLVGRFRSRTPRRPRRRPGLRLCLHYGREAGVERHSASAATSCSRFDKSGSPAFSARSARPFSRTLICRATSAASSILPPPRALHEPRSGWAYSHLAPMRFRNDSNGGGRSGAPRCAIVRFETVACFDRAHVPFRASLTNRPREKLGMSLQRKDASGEADRRPSPPYIKAAPGPRRAFGVAEAA
jgi:hypothetical protein